MITSRTLNFSITKLPAMNKLTGLLLLLTFTNYTYAQFPQQSQATRDSIRKLTEEDHKQMLAQLHITSPLRQGANGNDPNAPNAANYDESKANPFPNLPDPLTLKNGKKVTTSKMWWDQ